MAILSKSDDSALSATLRKVTIPGLSCSSPMAESWSFPRVGITQDSVLPRVGITQDSVLPRCGITLVLAVPRCGITLVLAVPRVE